MGFTAITRSLAQCFAAAVHLGRTFAIEGALGDYTPASRPGVDACAEWPEPYQCLLRPVTNCSRVHWANANHSAHHGSGGGGGGSDVATPSALADDYALGQSSERVVRDRSEFRFCGSFHRHKWAQMVPQSMRGRYSDHAWFGALQLWMLRPAAAAAQVSPFVAD